MNAPAPVLEALHARSRAKLRRVVLPEVHDERTVAARARLEREALAQVVWIEDIIDRVESQASSELWGLLKRPDEKYVTEHAYDNPKFVEDMVRDIAAELNKDARVEGYTVESENFESIHNHSAYAMITGARPQPKRGAER